MVQGSDPYLLLSTAEAATVTSWTGIYCTLLPLFVYFQPGRSFFVVSARI
jgi:hypothetical protein